jgi:simple sugar transport system permease protein
MKISVSMKFTPLIQTIPYVVTVIVLIFTSIRKKRENQPPAALGLPYFREER